MRKDKNTNKERGRGLYRATVLNIIGTILCVLLLPVVVANMTMAIQAVVNPDSPPNFLGYTPLIVNSGSMEPAFDTNDLVVVKTAADPENLEVGDVICYLTGQSLVTHRIVGVEYAEDQTVMYVTQGDANNVADSVRVLPEQIIGVYVTHFDNLGGFALFMQTPFGMLLCVVLPMLALFITFRMLDNRNYKAALAAHLAAAQGASAEKNDAGQDASAGVNDSSVPQ